MTTNSKKLVRIGDPRKGFMSISRKKVTAMTKLKIPETHIIACLTYFVGADVDGAILGGTPIAQVVSFRGIIGPS
jgi:hypothetical protein